MANEPRVAIKSLPISWLFRDGSLLVDRQSIRFDIVRLFDPLSIKQSSPHRRVQHPYPDRRLPSYTRDGRHVRHVVYYRLRSLQQPLVRPILPFTRQVVCLPQDIDHSSSGESTGQAVVQ